MITADELKQVLKYHPDTGVFQWVEEGTEAGCINHDGYTRIYIKGYGHYLAHRLAWLYVHKRFPIDQIDHRDSIKTNNIITNLREATNSQNQRNKSLSSNNTSGVKGVHWNSKTRKWSAAISIDGTPRSLGSSSCLREAVALRLAGEQCVDWDSFKASSSAYTYLNRRTI